MVSERDVTAVETFDDARGTVIERIGAPLRRMARAATAGGLVLLACAAIALAWANSPWYASYHALWEARFTLGLGPLLMDLSLHHVINDGLMAVFFFLVGLEIKREILVGELASVRRAALPVAAALGDMLVPALLFLAFNAGGEGARGWGIPMATDIAFALGVLALLGTRLPPSLRVMLSALAIADDMGAVLVIALFYTASVSWTALGAAAVLLLLSIVANAAGIRAAWAYALIGLALWVAVLISGVHATVAGVLLALTIPSRTRINEAAFMRGARAALDDFHDARRPELTVLSSSAHQRALRRLVALTEQAQAPLSRLEHGLHRSVTFGIMPLFALANAGVPLRGGGSLLTGSVATGVIAGLALGKTLGITAAAWAAVRTGLASLPAGVSWRMVHGLAWLGGIGFTMSLFIAGLAFPGDATLLTEAKLAILLASVVAGVVGWTLLRLAAGAPADDRVQAATAGASPRGPGGATLSAPPRSGEAG